MPRQPNVIRPASALGGPKTVPPGQVALSVSEALQRAGQFYNDGVLDKAEELARRILLNSPNLADAHNLLGVVLCSRGQSEAGVGHIRQAIALEPRTPSYYANLGEIERQRDNLDEAHDALSRALELDPNSPQAHNNLGIVHFDRRAFEEAAASYEAAIKLDPNFSEAHNNLGNAYRALDRRLDAVACYQRAVTLRENYAEAYNNMASALRDGNDVESAEHAYRKAIMIKPNYIEAYNNLSILLMQIDRMDDSLRYLGEAIKLDEKNLTTLLNIARVQLKRGSHSIAQQATRLAMQAHPGRAEPYAMLAEIHHELDQTDQAIADIERAIEMAPEAGDIYSYYGVLLKSAGRLEEARAAVRKAIDINPQLYSAYSNLNDLETFVVDHELLVQMEEILANSPDPESERYLPIHFALAKALDDTGQHARALEHWSIGCRLRRAQIKYDEAEIFSFFEAIKSTFSKDTFAKRRFSGNPSTVPVFIVGMPRSGSTLVEQIISSHPQAHGAGEIKVLHRTLGQLRDRFPSIPKYPAMINAMEPAHYEQVAAAYLAEATAGAPDALRVTDKLLTNFFFVGMIHLLFPNAKIIHTRRNPVDTCLSAFTKLFKDDMPHSYDFTELGRYYRRYEDLMAYWEEILPSGVMMSVDYEAVIEDLEGSARALVDHVGLKWDKACLAFHKSSRTVKTASVAQVRKPIYKTSVERWRRYGDGLAPLLEALEYPRDKRPARKPRKKVALA